MTPHARMGGMPLVGLVCLALAPVDLAVVGSYALLGLVVLDEPGDDFQTLVSLSKAIPGGPTAPR